MTRNYLYMLALLLVTLTALADPPNARDLLERAIANAAAQTSARGHYIFREHAEHLRLDGHVNHTQDFDWVFLEGAMYRKRIAVNGRPLAGKALREEERLFQMTAAERRQAAEHKKPDPNTINADIKPETVLHQMTHQLRADETLNGRPAWVIRSEPPPGLTGETRAYRYTYWIDKADIIIAQEHYDVFQADAKILPGSTQTTTFSRLNDSVWLLSSRDGEYLTGPPHPKAHWRQTHRFNSYRRFGSESTVIFEH